MIIYRVSHGVAELRVEMDISNYKTLLPLNDWTNLTSDIKFVSLFVAC